MRNALFICTFILLFGCASGSPKPDRAGTARDGALDALDTVESSLATVYAHDKAFPGHSFAHDFAANHPYAIWYSQSENHVLVTITPREKNPDGNYTNYGTNGLGHEDGTVTWSRCDGHTIHDMEVCRRQLGLPVWGFGN